MRLWDAVPFIILCLPYCVSCTQVAWNSPTTQSTTLVDALSADPDYTSLLRLLQRARLIPTLNKLNGSTLFAPTNDAIKRHLFTDFLWASVLQDEHFVVNDNVQEKLRQQLFYHLLNYSLPTLPEDKELQVHKTLHFPRTSVEPPSREPPPSPPWMPVPGGTLGGEPQRLRLASRDGDAFVGVDAHGSEGVKIVKGQVDAGNGVLLGVDHVIEVPPDLAQIVSSHQSLSYFHNILTSEIKDFLNTTSELTLFLPVNSAWDALDRLERLYLESDFAADDLYRILNMHALAEKGVKWSETFEPANNFTTVHGNTLEIVVSPEKTMIADAELVHPDVYASNGVLHLVSSLLVPPGALQLTPEKYLLALNCTTFVSLLHSVNLTSFINDTESKYTVLAPRDDVFSVFGDGEIPPKGSDELKKLLLYHFIPGRWTPKKLEDEMLLETALEEPGLNGGKQVLTIGVSGNFQSNAAKSIQFGGASVLGDYIEINNTLVYFVSRPITPPSDALETALPSLELSSFLAAIFSTSIANVLKTTPSTTFLIPHNSAFKRLGLLVSAHLLAASSKPDLQAVILHHAIDGVEYSQALQNGTQRTFATLEGSDIHLERSSNGSVLFSASGGWAGMKSELYPQNLLTKTGVIHELSDILVPRSVDLTIGKLMKAAKGSTMATLMNKAGLDWILNGTAPPEDSPWDQESLVGVGWTLLCPTDDAFKEYNLTELYEDVDGIRTLVTQHLIPTPKDLTSNPNFDVSFNNRPLRFEEAFAYSTLLSPISSYGDIIFKFAEGDDGTGYTVGIKGARGKQGHADWARVLSWGRSTTSGGTGGVIQIDRLLVPYQPPWWLQYGAPAIVGVIGIILICLFFYAVHRLWKRDVMEATYEPIGGFGRDDSDE